MSSELPESITVSLIIPCFNEQDGVIDLIDRCQRLCDARADVEVIIVDNGSTDATGDRLEARLRQHPSIRALRLAVNAGYGGGILAGLAQARGELLAWTHADGQTDPLDLLVALDAIGTARAGVFAKGERYGRPWIDAFLSAGMAGLDTLLLRERLWEINAQPTVFSRDLYLSWREPPCDFSLDLFAYYTAKRAQMRIFRFPVHFGPRTFGQSHWNTSAVARFRMIARTVRYSLSLTRLRT